uniref:Uncharacterized protein n=1 Tax=viral metagenome TaxID=1070528 RepID=A0A6M3L2H4_9ZZZZ
MTGPGCRGESTKKHVASQAQRRFFYAVAGGKASKNTSMTEEQAEHHLRMGKKQKGKLPSRVGRGIAKSIRKKKS